MKRLLSALVIVLGLLISLGAWRGYCAYTRVEALERDVAKLHVALADNRAAKIARQGQLEAQRAAWLECRARAEDVYNRNFALNGIPVPGKPGIRNIPTRILTNLRQEEREAMADCNQVYPHHDEITAGEVAADPNFEVTKAVTNQPH